MSWLIWKEYRLQRLVLAVGLVLLFAPCALPLVGELLHEQVGDAWTMVAMLSLFLSWLTAALLGGNAIAAERADRSAEFQCYLPISRWAILVSKLALPLAMMLLIWGSNLIFCLPDGKNFWDKDLIILGCFVVVHLCAFGVAWLVSSLQSSPTFAVASGLLAPISLAMFHNLLVSLTIIDIESKQVLFVSLFAIIVFAGLLSLAAGSWYYLHRVEP